MLTAISAQEKPVLIMAPQQTVACIYCMHGLLDPPALERKMPLYQERLVQYASGQLRCCTCEAGRTYLAWLTSATQKEQERARKEGALPDQIRAARQERIFENAGIPGKYAAYTLPGFERIAANDPAKRDAIAALRHYEQHGYAQVGEQRRNGIVLWGEPGVGKTGSMAPLFTQLVRNGRTGLWLQYNQFMADMRRFDDGQVDERMRTCQNADLLFIDDLGDVTASKSASDYAKDVLFRVIDHRTSRDMALFITTNLAPQELEIQFSSRITRRLLSACAVIRMGGRTLR